jgi:NAD(P)-dependent dehydrogenase (short-subunit alcohol dehydrogenase family)
MHRVWFITGASSGFGRALAEAAIGEAAAFDGAAAAPIGD